MSHFFGFFMIILRLTTLILYKTKAMNKLSLLMAILFAATAAIAQTNNEPSQQPQEEITVNKEYDDQGNLIRYDSTRTYRYYSDPSFDSFSFEGLEEMFSESSPLMQLFQGMFGNDSLFSGMPGFDGFPHQLFGNDSTMPFLFGFPDTSMVRDFNFRMDTTFTRNFSFQMDSTLFIGPDSSFLLPPGFIMPDQRSFDEFLRKFEDTFGERDPFSDFLKRRDPSDFDRFFDPEHRKEWEELMERHHREMEEMYRQWDQKDPQKEY